MNDDHAATATTLLREEHELILAVARALAGMLTAERDGEPLDYDTVA